MKREMKTAYKSAAVLGMTVCMLICRRRPALAARSLGMRWWGWERRHLHLSWNLGQSFRRRWQKLRLKKKSGTTVLKAKLPGPEEMKQAGRGHCRKPIG